MLAFGAADQSVAALQQAAKSLSVPLKVVQDTNEGGREAYESRLILVRPDQYVAWTGDEPPQDVAAVMRKAAGAT